MADCTWHVLSLCVFQIMRQLTKFIFSSFSLAKMQYKDGKGRAGVLILEQLTEYNGGYNTRPVIVQSEFLIHQRTECLMMMIEKLVLTKVWCVQLQKRNQRFHKLRWSRFLITAFKHSTANVIKSICTYTISYSAMWPWIDVKACDDVITTWIGISIQ